MTTIIRAANGIELHGIYCGCARCIAAADSHGVSERLPAKPLSLPVSPYPDIGSRIVTKQFCREEMECEGCGKTVPAKPWPERWYMKWNLAA